MRQILSGDKDEVARVEAWRVLSVSYQPRWNLIGGGHPNSSMNAFKA